MMQSATTATATHHATPWVARKAARVPVVLAERDRLHALAWAAHGDGRRPNYSEYAAALGLSLQSAERRIKALKDSGRWPWVGEQRPSPDDAAREVAARLVEYPEVPGRVAEAVRRASSRYPSLADEYESHAWASLWVIALDYRDDREDDSMGWGDYLAVKLRQALFNFRRSWTHIGTNRRNKALMLSGGPTGQNSDEWDALAWVPSLDCPVGWSIESEDAVGALMGHTSGRQREALERTYLRCSESVGDVAKSMGITMRTLQLHREGGLAKIRKAMGVDGVEGGLTG